MDFPGQDAAGNPLGKIAMRPLTQGEVILAKAEATKRARKIITEKFEPTERIEGYAQVFEDECACQILFLACRRPTNPDLPSFPRADDVRKSLTSDEIAVLINSYAIVQMKLGPLPESMGKVEFDAWVQRLRDGGSQLPLALLSSAQKNELIMYLVSLLPNSAEDNSSAGSPQEPHTPTT